MRNLVPESQYPDAKSNKIRPHQESKNGKVNQENARSLVVSQYSQFEFIDCIENLTVLRTVSLLTVLGTVDDVDVDSEYEV